MSRRPSHCERVLELLGDGRAHSHLEVYALGVIAHSRISDLRRRGWVIQQWHEKDPRTDERIYWYCVVSEPVPVEQRAEYLRAPAPSAQRDDVEGLFVSPGASGDEAAPGAPRAEAAALGAGEDFRNAVGDERSLEVSPAVQADLVLALLDAARKHRVAPLVLVGRIGSDELVAADLLRGRFAC